MEPTAGVFSDDAPTLIATTDAVPQARREEWRRARADVAVFESRDGLVPLTDLFAHLGKRDVQSVLLEGGPTIAWSAVREGCVDKLVLFLAPSLVGGKDAPAILGGEGLAPISEAIRVDIRSLDQVGGDIKVEAYVHRDR